jgi:hypothetical protein
MKIQLDIDLIVYMYDSQVICALNLARMLRNSVVHIATCSWLKQTSQWGRHDRINRDGEFFVSVAEGQNEFESSGISKLVVEEKVRIRKSARVT